MFTLLYNLFIQSICQDFYLEIYFVPKLLSFYLCPSLYLIRDNKILLEITHNNSSLLEVVLIMGFGKIFNLLFSRFLEQNEFKKPSN